MNNTTAGTRCRRQTVTVLFVDIVGFTGLVDELDCADVRDLQEDISNPPRLGGCGPAPDLGNLGT